MSKHNDIPHRIIQEFLKLLRIHGYKGTTTRLLAEAAQVNEVTIFRHFGNKKNILTEAVKELSYTPNLQKIVHEDIIWDLNTDLYLISKRYLDFLESIEDLVLISIREAEEFPEINQQVAEIPAEMGKLLGDYLLEMQKKRLIRSDIDTQAQAMNFILINFGYFLSNSRFGNDHLSSKEQYLTQSILLFSRGLGI